MRRLVTAFAAVSFALLGFIGVAGPATAATGTITDNGNGSATVTWSNSLSAQVQLSVCAQSEAAATCGDNGHNPVFDISETLCPQQMVSPMSLVAGTNLHAYGVAGGCTSGLPAGTYNMRLSEYGSTLNTASNVVITGPSGSITDAGNGTATVTYVGAMLPTVVLCAVGTSDMACQQPPANQYRVGLTASPTTIAVGTEATKLGTPGRLKIAAGTYKMVLTTGGSTVLTSLASMTLLDVTKPGAPGKPTAVAGSGAATVTVVAPTTGSAVVSYTVTSSPDSKTCTVTVPATSCEVTGLTAGGTYTFTSTATNAGGTSEASAASDAITLPRASNTPTTAPNFAHTKDFVCPGRTTVLKNKVTVPAVTTVIPTVRLENVAPDLLGSHVPEPAKLGTYKVKKNGKVVVNVFTSKPVKITLTLRAKGNAQYLPYKQVKTWVIK